MILLDWNSSDIHHFRVENGKEDVRKVFRVEKLFEQVLATCEFTSLFAEVQMRTSNLPLTANDNCTTIRQLLVLYARFQQHHSRNLFDLNGNPSQGNIGEFACVLQTPLF